MAKIIDKRIADKKAESGQTYYVTQDTHKTPAKQGKNLLKYGIVLLILGTVFLILLLPKMSYVGSMSLFILILIVSGALFIIGIILKAVSGISTSAAKISHAYQSPAERVGRYGEDEACRLLSFLPESYTVYRNTVMRYEGKSSEIDTIVVGPGGIFIVEIKNLKGDLYGDFEDNDWIKVKRAYGETFQENVYNPTKQVSTHVYRLAKNLHTIGINRHIDSIVYFVHPECVLHITGKTDCRIFLSAQGQDRKLMQYIQKDGDRLTKNEIFRINNFLYRYK